jgi:hypothetical protein
VPVTSTASVGDSHAILDELAADLSHVDELLRSALAQVSQAFGDRASDPRFAGLVIPDGEPERLLGRQLAHGELDPQGLRPQGLRWRCRRLVRVADACGLGAFEAFVVLLAVAPEIDLRYQRIYAYLQDDVTRVWPTVALALDLFAPDAGAKLELRRRFWPEAPLRAHGLLTLVGDRDATPPLLARGLRPADGLVRFLLGDDGVDEALAGWCRLQALPGGRWLERSMLTQQVGRQLSALAPQGSDGQGAAVILLDGGDGAEHEDAACVVAHACGRPLLRADLARLPEGAERDAVRAVRRAAVLHGAVVYLRGAERSRIETSGAELLLDGTVPVVAGLELAQWLRHAGASDVHVTLPAADFSRRRALWRTALDNEPLADSAAVADALARRFRLSPAAVRDVVVTARAMTRWRSTDQSSVAMDPLAAPALMEAARAATRGSLEGLARRIVPRRSRPDLILPADRLALLDAISAHIEFGPIVTEEWGFGRVMSRGGGIVALFSGAPGTGKTLAAEVLAGELGLDLYAIDLSQIVNKYIGETEKNLARVFDAAETSSAVLFFDEADALFGARSEVRDAHDRYANIEVGYLLQRMEEYSGLAVLASNLQRNMDEAFLRRVRFVVSFPFPDAESRGAIWQATWPEAAPAADLDFQELGRRFDVTGATIRDAAVSAAFLAAAQGSHVTLTHIEEAMRREYSKLGRVPADLTRRGPDTAPHPRSNGR